MRDVVVVDSVRTGLAKSFRGSFNWTRSDDMAAFLIDALIDRNPNFDPGEVDDIILGAANQSGEQSGNLARMASFLSKLPIEATGTTRKSVLMAILRRVSGTCRIFLSPSSTTSPSRGVRSMKTNIDVRTASGESREPVISGFGKNIINAATMFVYG